MNSPYTFYSNVQTVQSQPQVQQKHYSFLNASFSPIQVQKQQIYEKKEYEDLRPEENVEAKKEKEESQKESA